MVLPQFRHSTLIAFTGCLCAQPVVAQTTDTPAKQSLIESRCMENIRVSKTLTAIPAFSNRQFVAQVCHCAAARIQEGWDISSSLASLTSEADASSRKRSLAKLSSLMLTCAANVVASEPEGFVDAVPAVAKAFGDALSADPIVEKPKAEHLEIPRSCGRPEYPAPALRSGAEGITGLLFLVDAQGKVTNIDIVRSSGNTIAHKLLDFQAALSLSKCEFGALAGARQGLSTWSRLEYEWRIR